jgi:GT2 family glycosyltransferase
VERVRKKFPKVSVIILTYNGSKYIEALLESLFDQSYPRERMEIIVIDNASTDNTLSLVQEGYPDVRRVGLSKNIGFAAGNNQALKHARHDFLVFLNQDTICHRDWLKGLIQGLLDNKKIGVCTSNMILPGTAEFNTMDKRSSLSSLYICDLSPFGYGRYRKITGKPIVFPKIFSGCSFVIRRETLTELGYLFDDQLWMYVEDTDLSLRIHNMGLRICAVRDSIVYHLHNSDVAMNADNLYLVATAIMNRVYVFLKNMGSLEFFVFFPLLWVGGIFKIFELRLRPSQKAAYFLPFALLSLVCMLWALLRLPQYANRRLAGIKKRRVKGFYILKLILNCNVKQNL